MTAPAVDDGAAQAALGVVVGRVDAVDDGEGPERGPPLEQVLGEEPVTLGLGALGCCALEQRPELLLERGDLPDQRVTVAVCLELLPGDEQPRCDLESCLAELVLSGEPVCVGGEVPDEVGPAELAPVGVEVVVGPPAIRAGDAREVLAEQRLWS